VIFIVAALLIIIFTAAAAVAKARKLKKAALIGLIVVLAVLCGLFLLGYVHGAYYAGQVFWTSPWVWLPFFLLCVGMFAAITYLRKLNRVQ
jgi:lysylphosphatidylglycerol synthetase-like protein (DUF2156 family)